MSLDTTESQAKVEPSRLLPATMEDRIVKLIGRAGGVALLVVLALLWISLITWSVTDPSLTYAAAGRAQNALGPLGAIVSDLLLQMLGFAAVVALLTPMFWALDLMASERVPGFRVKGSFYPLSVLVMAGGLSSLPVPKGWPLHHGVGGILGDVLFNLATSIFAVINPERAGFAAGLVLMASGLSALSYSIGIELKDLGAFFERAPVPQEEEVSTPVSRTWWQRLWSRREEVAGEQEINEPSFGENPHGVNTGEAHGAPWGMGGQHYGQQGPYFAQGPVQHGFDPSQGYVVYAQPVPGYGPPSGTPHPGSGWPPHNPMHPQAWQGPYPHAYGVADTASPQPQAGRETQVNREPGFDSATDWASRDIAERFAPGGLPKERPGPAEQERIAKKPGSTLLSGLSFRRQSTPAYKKPSINMLKRPSGAKAGPEFTQTVLRGNARLLEDVLADFGVKGEVRDIKPGPVITLFELEPARGTKSARVIGLSDDIARSMSATSVRVAVVPGRNAIGIELPNVRREPVLLREILDSDAYRSADMILPLALGKSISGEPVVADLARMPHLLVAGTTGSGKSVGINAMVLSLLYKLSPDECRLIMIDPKMLELSVYNGIPHLLTPVVTDPHKALAALNWAVSEMEERYKRMAKLAVRNIDVFNNRVRNARKRGEIISRTVQTGFDRNGQAIYEKEDMELEPMPYIVIVVDEFADLMIVAGKEIEAAVQRLAQMARAAGIHLVMATQRPSVDIVTGVIKANFPTRISFRVASKIDSRTILNEQGAEQLLGQGDMLFSTGSGQPSRVHGAFVADEEVESIAKFLRDQGEPRYVANLTEAQEGQAAGSTGEARGGGEDDLYDRAVAIVMRDRKASTSYIQRRLSIGYNRAADLIERMEREGLISAANSVGRREILGGEPEANADR